MADLKNFKRMFVFFFSVKQLWESFHIKGFIEKGKVVMDDKKIVQIMIVVKNDDLRITQRWLWRLWLWSTNKQDILFCYFLIIIVSDMIMKLEVDIPVVLILFYLRLNLSMPNKCLQNR